MKGNMRIQIADKSLLVRCRMTSSNLASIRSEFSKPDLPYPSAGDIVTINRDGRTREYFVVSVRPVDDGVEVTATLNVQRTNDPSSTAFRRKRLIELRQQSRRQA